MQSHRQHIQAITLLGIPIIIGQLGSVVQGFADTIMVGNYGTAELSSAGFVNNVYNLVFFFLLGISYATTPVTGAYFGRGDHAGMSRSLRESLLVNLGVSLVVVLLLGGLYFRLEWLHQPTELLPLIRPYYLTLLVSMPALALFNAMKQHLDAMGQTKVSMYIMVTSNVINIILNALLIFGLCGMPRLGLLGAGIATLLSRIFMAVAIWFYLPSNQKSSTPESKVTREGCLHLLKIGFPISTQLCLEAASFSICAIFMGWLGSIPLAAHQVMATISTLLFMVLYGIGAAAAIRISQFRGRKEWAEIRRTAMTAWGMNAVMASVLISLVWIFNGPLVRLFTPDERVSQMALILMPALVFYQLGDCTQITFANALRGIERVKRMMLFAFIAYVIISLPMSYFLGFIMGWGPRGVWLGIPFGLTTAGLLFLTDFLRNLNKIAHA